MHKFATAGLCLLTLCVLVLMGFKGYDAQEPITRPQLKEMLTQLGYEVKDLDSTAGKEKYSTTIESGGLNIPVAFEISPNNNFIWLTVFLKDGFSDTSSTCGQLLRKNADIQPSQYYITKSNKLMMGLCVENHGVTNAILRQRAEKIVNDVVNTKDIWQK